MGPQFGHNAQREVLYATDRASEHLPGGEPPGNTPWDQLMDAWGTPGAEENTTGPEGSNPDTRADDHIEQLQAWFGQETEKKLQEVTLAGDHGHHQSPLLWQLYQRKIATARMTRPWKC